MKRQHYVVLFLIGLLVPFVVSRFQDLPGYMDADYYFAGGIQLAEGRGFTEPYIWNYLSDPQTLPNPSHSYWMPLASIVSALGMWIAGSTTYAAGRAPFILLSACVPILIATLAFDLTRQTRLAMISGLLSIFSFFYAPFMPVPDNYALYMIFGATFLLLAAHTEKWIPLALGALAGLLTLSRSDGLLWLGLAGLTIFWNNKSPLSSRSTLEGGWERAGVREKVQAIIFSGILTLTGYLLIMGFWHYRNYMLFDSFLAPGGGRLLWLENYNQTFMYPPEALTREGFLQAGWGAALRDRIQALGDNFSNAWIAQGLFLLFPFLLVGLWKLRRDFRTRLAISGWTILFLVMTLVFPFAGSRGSFFHAGAAFQPMWWVAVPIGMEALVDAIRRKGMFTDGVAPYLFQGLLVFVSIIATATLVQTRVIANGWAKDDVIYPSVEAIFQDNGIRPNDVVIVRNPPGYYIASGRSAVSLPFGDESTILAVAEKFDAKYLVLEESGTFDAIQDLYDDPDADPRFTYLGEVDGARLYRIEASN